MKNFNKKMQNIFKGLIRPKIFFLFAFLFSSQALAKQNITQNISVIFKRFEWIKRNRDNEDFPSHKITINYPNPLLKSLVSKFEPSFKNNLAALVRNTEKKEKKKKSKWSSWGLVDISISNLSKNGFENAKTSDQRV